MQGIARELWVKSAVNGGLEDLANGMLLITKDAHCDFIKDFYLYDEIIVKFSFSRKANTNATICFDFYHGVTHELHAKGYQTIVFADHEHKIIKMPLNWKAAIECFLVPLPVADVEPA